MASKRSKTSAGLMMYRVHDGEVEALLVHPGGPFWKNRDAGAWFIPKGELNENEEPLSAAKREFAEETGLEPHGSLQSLGSVTQKSGKTILAWAFQGDCDPAQITSNTFSIEWPPKSGRQQEFPEIDRAHFFNFAQAKEKMHAAEFPLFQRLLEKLKQK